MIKYFVMDVDGTLTDGKIYIGQNGEEFKAFSVKDGAGISLLLPKYNITPVIITARKSNILVERCKELGITMLYQGVKDKLKLLLEIVGEDLSSVVYAGDDIPDISCMEMVKRNGGQVVCPSDAILEIKEMADYISVYKSGDGAIRDCINFIINSRLLRKDKYLNSVSDTISLLMKEDLNNKELGIYRLSNGVEYVIQDYITKEEKDCFTEIHRYHTDIQYIVSGCEKLIVYSSNCLNPRKSYDYDRDVEIVDGGIISSSSVLLPGSVIVIKNGQPHKGAIKFLKSERVKKAVCKIRIN